MLNICNEILGQKTSFKPVWTSFPDPLHKKKELIQVFGMNGHKCQGCAGGTSML